MGCCKVVPWVPGMGGLCMELTGSEGVEGTAVTMMVVRAYNCCIGTMGESPKQGIHHEWHQDPGNDRDVTPTRGSQWQNLPPA